VSHRHRARRLALQGLCCLDVQGRRAIDGVDAFLDDSRETGQTILHARHWELSRLALVDRNILRLGVCELRRGRTPLKVVISEALRLAQEFSTAESPRFVNGVLDAVAKEIAGDARDKGSNNTEDELSGNEHG